MEQKIINLEDFCLKLQHYKEALEEMNLLTTKELERVSSMGICVAENNAAIEKDAAMFVNQQMNTFLEKLATLIKVVPYQSIDKEVFLTDEIQWLQIQVLDRLKSLKDPGKFVE